MSPVTVATDRQRGSVEPSDNLHHENSQQKFMRGDLSLRPRILTLPVLSTDDHERLHQESEPSAYMPYVEGFIHFFLSGCFNTMLVHCSLFFCILSQKELDCKVKWCKSFEADGPV